MTEKDIYICACAENGGLYHYKLDAYGRLRFCSETPLDRPMYAAAENDTLYVLLRAPFRDSEYSALAVLPVTEGGRPGEVQSLVSTGGTVSAHLCVRGGVVYTANYVSGSITKLPDRVVCHNAYAREAAAAHPHFVSFTPDGNYIAAVDLGLDTVFVYTADLEPVSAEKVPTGSGCRHLAFSPEGDLAYCVNEISSDVSVLAYSDGRFRLLGTYPALPEDFTGYSAAAAARCTQDFVYVSHRGYNSISRIPRYGAKLGRAEQIPCGGSWPRDFAVFEDMIVCTNEKSNTVTVIHNGQISDEQTLPSPIAVFAV